MKILSLTLPKPLERLLRRIGAMHVPNPYAVESVWELQKARREESRPVYATWDEYQRELRLRIGTVYQREESANVRHIRSKATK